MNTQPNRRPTNEELASNARNHLDTLRRLSEDQQEAFLIEVYQRFVQFLWNHAVSGDERAVREDISGRLTGAYIRGGSRDPNLLHIARLIKEGREAEA